ncbi:peptidoglycan DD-metalloendopeptidase family protein [Sulfurimonas aquatica]|uniref:Peptidoglycan DD-metalloendopeptidase family protein n=1 Tax=Sulfurimonas aquatica TaxID=2672570 RepID=A0A975AZV2_9BACT|nr:M23 family metallopeptidase [Sulfurimonas aquatica]QSZ41644.1 peptidoglycan DD-metalloendopeptidase family protein [Sulfurimonas aquatica]
MIIRFILFFSFSLLYSLEYPSSYAHLGTPLYKSQKILQNIETFSSLDSVKNFCVDINTTRENGFKLDTSKDKSELKSYLKNLRKLRKKYEYIVYELHRELESAIEKDDYEKFCLIVNSGLDGILQRPSLQEKAFIYYAKNKTLKKSPFLEKKIERNELLLNTLKEQDDEIINSSYNSTNIKDEDIGITTKRVHNKIEVSFYNKHIYDITLKVKPYYESILHRQTPKSEIIIQANSTYLYETLEITGDNNAFNYNFIWSIGSKDAKHDDEYEYRLPYETTTKHRVSQGYNTNQTHKGRSKYSVDFAMPIGTKVLASREGTIISVKSSSDRGGYSKEFRGQGNYVRVLHSDGTIAIYYHLKKDGAVVNIGDKVKKGELIGYSGNTGYSSGPHLHMAVYKAISAVQTKTIKVKYISAEGLVKEMKTAETYQAI